ncbi:MAG: maleylacetoacetate isomerase [Casimicrobiaceae bacterium]|nr:maleylacetoacetate isomerase [Casimicrobiaceae bacterium]MCX8099166.1 maleylacetoacetate isomerase [Casimicrobiaceae bacterium]MDW8312605.1 maleylacetoacetate isomerase [Burkholderiales bacterium]
MKLYTYFRSSAAYRVRIALNLKGLQSEHVPVHLLQAEQRSERYRAVNPAGLVPALELDNGEVLTQSLAIIEWLDERYPEPHRLLPGDVETRARIRAFALTIACDIHPINNLRVMQYLEARFGADETARAEWTRHWIALGFSACEAMLEAEHRAGRGGRFAFGDSPTLADCVLVPQCFNARRFDLDLGAYPRLAAVEAQCLKLDAFARAHPLRQPDAPPA